MSDKDWNVEHSVPLAATGSEEKRFQEWWDRSPAYHGGISTIRQAAEAAWLAAIPAVMGHWTEHHRHVKPVAGCHLCAAPEADTARVLKVGDEVWVRGEVEIMEVDGEEQDSGVPKPEDYIEVGFETANGCESLDVHADQLLAAASVPKGHCECIPIAVEAGDASWSDTDTTKCSVHGAVPKGLEELATRWELSSKIDPHARYTEAEAARMDTLDECAEELRAALSKAGE